MKKNILFVDPRVTYYQFHVDALNPQTDAWYLLEAHLDGVNQMATIVKTYDHLESIQILSYVEANTVLLGSSQLNEQQLDTYELPFKKIGARLANKGKIILGLYGATNNAKNKRGIKSTFVNHLSLLLNKPVSVFTAVDESKELTLSVSSFKHTAQPNAQASFTIPPEVLAEISASVDDLIDANQARPHLDNASFDDLQFKQQPFDQQFLDAYVNQNALNHWSVKPLTIAVAMTFSTTALSEPTGGQATAGQATINQSGAVTTINQTTQKAAIDWHTFNVKSHEAVNFNQPNASAITLNRVTGTESSSIMGSITANGKVFILNPNGVLIGAGAQVNVGGMVASTLNISNQDFLNDNFSFKGIGSGTVENNGNINIAEGGLLALIAPVVKNSGTINAPQGDVLLAAADDVTLTLQDGSLTSFTLNKGSVQTLIDNGGLIQADGGHVVLTAKGVDALSKSAINHTGIIEAQTVSSKDGKIELLGDMEFGELNVAGKLDASAPTNGDGGFVETSAAKVKVADSARVTTLAANGKNGTWLIDPTDFTVAASGGDMTGQAVTNALAGGNFIIDSDNGSNGTGGDVYINDSISWSANTMRIDADNNIYINRNLNGSGTAMLALNYGLGSADGAGSDYYITGAKVNLPEGLNFGTKKGLNGAFTTYQVITQLGIENDTSITSLQGMKNNLSGNYVLGRDIDASVTGSWFSSNKGFIPIGSRALYGTYDSGIPFTGVLDGLGHAINGLQLVNDYIEGANLYNRYTDLGLIGTCSSCSVRNLGVTNISYNAGGTLHAGGVIGSAATANIQNLYSSGSIINSWNITGGLIGRTDSSTIDQAYSSVEVTGRSFMGGLIGALVSSTLTNSYVTGQSSLVHAADFSTIKNSYSSNSAIIDAMFLSSVSDSYWDREASGIASSIAGTSKTTAQMQQQSTYPGWDFDNIWRISPGDYPRLRALTQGTIVVDTPNLGLAGPKVNKVYDGVAVNTIQDLSTLNGWLPAYNGLTITGLLNGDSLTNASIFSGMLNYGGTWQGAKNAGSYTIVPSGIQSQKYQIVYTNGSLTIDPKLISVTGTKVYDGSTNADFANASLNGVLQQDADEVYLLNSQGILNSKDVGTRQLINTENIALAGLASSNYTISQTGNNWIISPLNVNVTALGVAADDKTKVYGNPDPEFTYKLNTGTLLNGDTFAGQLTRELGENVGNYAIQQGTLSAGNNYTINFTDGNLSITPRPLVVWGSDHKLNEGDPLPTFSYRVYDDITNKVAVKSLVESITFSDSAARRYDNAGWGTFPIEINNVSVNPNYVVSKQYNGTLLVEPKEVFLLSNNTREAIRIALNANLPNLEQAIDVGSPWVEILGGKTSFHQNNIGLDERKFVHPDGREVVYDGDSHQILTDKFGGTYNFTNDSDSSIDHGVQDVVLGPETYQTAIDALIFNAKRALNNQTTTSVSGDTTPTTDFQVEHNVFANGYFAQMLWPQTTSSIENGVIKFTNSKPVAVTAVLWNPSTNQRIEVVIPPAIGTDVTSAVADMFDNPITGAEGLVSSVVNVGGTSLSFNVPEGFDLNSAQIDYKIGDEKSRLSTIIGIAAGQFDIFNQVTDLSGIAPNIPSHEFKNFMKEIMTDALSDVAFTTKISSIMQGMGSDAEKAAEILDEANGFMANQIEKNLVKLGLEYYTSGLPEGYLKKLENLNIAVRAIKGISIVEKQASVLNAFNYLLAFPNPSVVEQDVITASTNSTQYSGAGSTVPVTSNQKL